MGMKIIADRTINLDETRTIALDTHDIRQAYVLVNEGNEIDVDTLAEYGCAVGEDGKIIVGAPVLESGQELKAVDVFATPSEDVTHEATEVVEEAEPKKGRGK
jgi:hypothetical protein